VEGGRRKGGRRRKKKEEEGGRRRKNEEGGRANRAGQGRKNGRKKGGRTGREYQEVRGIREEKCVLEVDLRSSTVRSTETLLLISRKGIMEKSPKIPKSAEIHPGEVALSNRRLESSAREKEEEILNLKKNPIWFLLL
jgi:hypothetical protein